MKTSPKSFILPLVFMGGIFTCNSAYVSTIGGVTYSMENGYAKVTDLVAGHDVYEIQSTVSHNRVNYVVNEIDFSSYKRYMNIEKLFIPSTITSISMDAFSGEIFLKELHIEDLFVWCNIDFEYSVSFSVHNDRYDYGSDACPMGQETKFYVNDELVETLIIPEGITEIKPFSFSHLNCKEIIIGGDVEEIGVHSFEHSTVSDLWLGKNLKEIGQNAFIDCKELERVTGLFKLPYPVNNYIFTGCDIKEVYMPSLESMVWLQNTYNPGENGMGSSVFGHSYTLYIDDIPIKDVIIPPTEDRLGNFCLSGANNLRSVVCEEGIKTTGYQSFTWCENLEKISFPSTLEVYNTNLRNCPALRTMEIKSLVPPVVDELYAMLGYDTPELYENCSLHVPAESVELYRSDKFFSQFKNILPIDESGVESITDENQQDKVVYDLQGRKVSGENLAPGIYVIDGKKIKI